MGEKDALVDKTVSWSKAGKSGTYPDKKTGEPRKWQMWSFKVEGDERYFTWFENSKTATPKEGDFIKAAEIECGTYTKSDGSISDNYTAKWITYGTSETPHKPLRKPPDAPQRTISPKTNDIGPMTMWGKYIGEVVCAFIKQGWDGQVLDDKCKNAMETFADCCIIFEKTYSNVNELPKPNTDPINLPTFDAYGEPESTFSDGTPIGEPPDWVK